MTHEIDTCGRVSKSSHVLAPCFPRIFSGQSRGPAWKHESPCFQGLSGMGRPRLELGTR